jgi:hypothetical protein
MDDPAAELDQIKAELRTSGAGYADEARLVAAVEKVLEPHRPGRVTILGALCGRHENHRHFSITRTEAEGIRSCPDCKATVYTSCAGCGPQVSAEECRVRAAITAELTKGEGT